MRISYNMLEQNFLSKPEWNLPENTFLFPGTVYIMIVEILPIVSYSNI